MKPDQLQRLVDARHTGEQALFTVAAEIIAEANKGNEPKPLPMWANIALFVFVLFFALMIG